MQCNRQSRCCNALVIQKLSEDTAQTSDELNGIIQLYMVIYQRITVQENISKGNQEE